MKGQAYVPNYGDLERFRYEALTRTKSRAYQIACWQGYLGTHEFFLGRSLRGWSILLFTMLAASSFLYSWVLGVVLVCCVVALNFVCIRQIASTDPESDMYGTKCGPIFHGIAMLTQRSIFWDINYWKGKKPTDPPATD